jgi:hypothetical protein
MQIGFTGLLTLIFITLKLIGYIEWAWIWVLSPLWIGFVLFFALALLMIWSQPGARLTFRKRK